MKTDTSKKHHIFRLLLSGIFLTALIFPPQIAFAEKPLSHPQDKNKTSKNEDHDGQRQHGRSYGDQRDNDRVNVSLHFGDQQRVIVHDYYDKNHSSGFCPPGLAKKHNGCMPPGQAKKWSKGHPLPRDVVFYDLPPRLVVELGVPPAGHRYVRVAADILLIAIGTGIVIDAVEDLGRM